MRLSQNEISADRWTEPWVYSRTLRCRSVGRRNTAVLFIAVTSCAQSEPLAIYQCVQVTPSDPSPSEQCRPSPEQSPVSPFWPLEALTRLRPDYSSSMLEPQCCRWRSHDCHCWSSDTWYRNIMWTKCFTFFSSYSFLVYLDNHFHFMLFIWPRPAVLQPGLNSVSSKSKERWSRI